MLFHEDRVGIFRICDFLRELENGSLKGQRNSGVAFPRNFYEVRSIHVLTSFYRKFIKNFSSICAPIMETIKIKHQPFEWT